ncbi:transcriptional regulator NanR [Aureimonas frigidaquae]|uniref:GntR family transcriptional regulator n=1 Tax=Aureimonas frigidaquae TaxID=424757 RepID=A0A0P0Z0R0_9HYPH|nr:transcriptional regulator NanR [Aureimonas frigidaquae]BAT27581.1 GntR family transcriptional regulator [Aureimonas frigidaquae]
MEPVQKRKLSHQVLERLVEAISTSEFPPGSQLPSERELMSMTGVGRPSIREAMLSLQQMGLIKISHGERARVINPTPDVVIDQISAAMIMLLATSPRGLDELKEARLWLETGLVAMATRNATAHDLDALAASIRALQDARDDQARFIAADLSFHALIAEMSGNGMVAAITRGMLEWLSRFKRDLVSKRGKERLTIEEHDRIYRAIASGDAEAAAQAMRQHIGRANQLYWQEADPSAVTQKDA